ncbi:MAG: hypothetical protein WC042_00615 [Candidatus Paceibacterota bacterium]|nr:hypothetical protein [Candidatus Paceibacterota bacterium]MDD3548462.1 hypothetical protein [Candidatus Paceibacterota bacterium]MDD4999241.1 hypothetical protein [Candidatus Paceibacterota bacterium]MDD5545505.1 hypothetical protein [Candidatus Paceibacterota bacterium]
MAPTLNKKSERLLLRIGECSKELIVIDKKLKNPQVPQGKKEKLIFRQNILKKKIGEWLNHLGLPLTADATETEKL